MKISYLLSFLSIALNTGVCQTTIIALEDTLSYKGAISYTNFSTEVLSSSFDFSENLDFGNQVEFVKKLELTNLLQGGFVDGLAYQSIYYTYFNFRGDNYIWLDMNGDSVFQTNHILKAGDLDSVILSFYVESTSLQEEEDSRPIEVLVRIAYENNQLSFIPYQLFTGQIVIDDSTYYVTVWPFQLGVKIKVGKDHQFLLLGRESNLFDENEIFDLAEKKFRFSKFNYTNKTIELECLPLETPLFGYKIGSLFKPWLEKDKNPLPFDSLGINRNLSHLIYFGAKWCDPCQSEIPKLQNLFPLLQRNNLGLICVIAQHNESIDELNDYSTDKNIPGVVLIEDMKANETFIRQLHIYRYPTYVFIDAQSGEILYRSDKTNLQLHEFLFDFLR